MNGNPLKARLARQLPAFGGWCTTGSPFAAELIALQGFHFVGLDAQHGLFSYDSLLTCMMALARTGSAIVVRMPSRDAAAAGRILDAGAHGIIFPMIETPDDAREAVDACRIYPGGRRSFGPLRAAQSFGRDPDAVSAGVTCMAMIETARGVENIDAIAADLQANVPGVGNIHHVHIWSLTSEQPHVTLHARCADRNADVVGGINARLKAKYGIAHSTIQMIRCPRRATSTRVRIG